MNWDAMKINRNEITALIAVKGNSERVPKKNVRPFAGSSLLEVKLKQVIESEAFGRILVSSEDDEILAVCERAGVSTHKRDAYYSTSEVPMSEVYQYLAREVQTEHIAWIPVTNPLVHAGIYRDAVSKYFSMDHTRHDSLVSVTELHEYIFFENKPLNFTRDPWMRSQDLKGTYAINFAINILKKENMISFRATFGEKPEFFVVPDGFGLDIDYMEDFLLAELIYKQRQEG